jgi:hypothetical protein
LKAPRVDIAVQVWGILDKVITNNAGMLSSKVEGELGSFITLREHTFTNCEAALRDEMQRAEEMTALIMPVGEMVCGYIMDGAMKPKLHLWIFPCCEAQYMHEPPSNKDIHRRNKEKLEEYARLNKHLDNFNEGQCSDLPMEDRKGKATTRINALKL